MNSKELNWKDNKLYFGTKDTKYSIVPCLYKIRFPDGHLSEDVYNISRAHQNAKDLLTEDL